LDHACRRTLVPDTKKMQIQVSSISLSLALFGLFLFAGRIGETVRVRDGGGVKGGGGGGDRLGGVPAHQLRGG